jgi:transposase InsO family protein
VAPAQQSIFAGQKSYVVRGGSNRRPSAYARTVRAACQRLGIRQSMGRLGSALDNAVIESWHSTLEFELRSLVHFATRAAARARVPAWSTTTTPVGGTHRSA